MKRYTATTTSTMNHGGQLFPNQRPPASSPHSRRGPVGWSAVLLALLCFHPADRPAMAGETMTKPFRIFIVSSYHREYLWSQATNRGVCDALVKMGLLDSEEQIAAFSKNDGLESAKLVLKKDWMDAKRHGDPAELARATTRISKEIDRFKPDLILLGDDNAANFLGNAYLDTEVPVVFWGINGLPMRYGLLDTMERPGHNVTGVYQAGYAKECIEFLTKCAPKARTFAILSDDSETGRAKAKHVTQLAKEGELPLQLVECVTTNRFDEWKQKAMKLQETVDAFFIVNHNTIKNEKGEIVDPMDVGRWYLENVRIPECADEMQFAVEGMLCVCDDSGYNQGFEAVRLAHRILVKKESPATIAVKAPARGPFILNRARAKMLGIDPNQVEGVEATVDEMRALKPASRE